MAAKSRLISQNLKIFYWIWKRNLRDEFDPQTAHCIQRVHFNLLLFFRSNYDCATFFWHMLPMNKIKTGLLFMILPGWQCWGKTKRMLKITQLFVSGKNLLWTIQHLCQKNVKLNLKLHQSRWKLKLRLKLGIKVSCWCWGNVLDSNQIVCQDSGQHHSWLQSLGARLQQK